MSACASAVLLHALLISGAPNPVVPTGTGHIYYVVSEGHEPVTRVMRIRPNGRGRTVLSEGQASYVYGPSPDGRHLALTVDNDLFLMKPKSGRTTRLTQTKGVEWYPRFSPNGRWLLFESSHFSFRDLYKIRPSGGEPIRLTNNKEGNFDGTWSPNGRHIAFASSRTGRLELWVMDANGKNARKLTHHSGDSIKPAWSPSGRWIAFISDRDGQDNLFVIRPRSGEVIKLTPPAPKDRRLAMNVSRFAWHPKQDRIVYAARPLGKNSQLFIVDVPSQQRIQRSSSQYDDREPAWSPDGRHIVFSSKTAQQSNVFIMKAKGSTRTQVTFETGRAWLPGWYLTRGERQ